MNNIFISYARPNYDIARKLNDEINEQLANSFHAELVEDRKESDTTFTEKVIRYFKNCNVFIVILTDDSLSSQWLNQEWGFAKCLKEYGQIQVLLHITQSGQKQGRIKSKGFIAENMDFIDLQYYEAQEPDVDRMVEDTIALLRQKEPELLPIIPEKQQKLRRFINEMDRNIELVQNLIDHENDLRAQGAFNPRNFLNFYALQILDIGHMFPSRFCNEIEDIIENLQAIQVKKDQVNYWVISRGAVHGGIVADLFSLLRRYISSFRNLRDYAQDLYDPFLSTT